MTRFFQGHRDLRKEVTNLVITSSKLTTLEQGNGVILVSLLLTSNIFHTVFIASFGI